MFSLEPSLTPLPLLRPALPVPAPHIPVLVRPSWGLTPNPPELAITAPATAGPATSGTANPSLAITSMVLEPNIPAQEVACTQFTVALNLGMAAPTHGAATNTLVAKASSTAEQIAQVPNLLTYIRL